MLRLDILRETADSNIIEGKAVPAADKPKCLARRRQVAKHDSVERDNGDQMTSSPTVAQTWPKSYEHCLFSHWRILPYSVG
jgi:hypothetical protein